MSKIYKYYLDNKEFTPLNLGDFTFNINLETESGAFHYTREINGKIAVNGATYEYILKGSETQNFYIDIFEQCQEGEFKIFELYFTFYNCEFSPDERRVLIEPKQNTLFNCLTSNYDKEFNFLEVANVVNSVYENTPQYEYIVKGSTPPAASLPVPFFGSYVRDFSGNFSVYNFAYLFVRELKTVYCQGGEPQAPPGAGWEIFINECETDNTITYYRKPPIFTDPTNLLQASFQQTFCAVPGCTPAPPPITGANEDWQAIYKIISPGGAVYYWADYNVIKGPDLDFNNGRLLTDVINYGLNKDCGALDLQSNFLTNNINPVTGNLSSTANLQIHSISDIKDANATEPATIERITLKQILNDYISSKLNCFWRIDEQTNRLIIEHYNDLNFTGSTDLRTINGGKWLELKNKYNFDNSDTPKAEAFPSLDFSIDYTGVNIQYNNDVGEGVKNFNTDKFYSEIELITTEPDTYPNDGAVIITPESLKPIGQTGGERSEVGAITGIYGPNMPQAMANLQSKFFKYWRPFKYGELNFIQSEFLKNRPNKKAESLIIPLNCFFLFDPYSNFITNRFNNGILQSATFNPKTGFIELELKYFD